MKNKPLEITSEFTSKTLTIHAGIFPINQFLSNQLSFDHQIDQSVDLPIGSNTKYDTATILKSIIYGYLADFKRLVHFSVMSGKTDSES